MKILCIHMDDRVDRAETFESGVGKDCDFEYFRAISKREQPVVSDYKECLGDLCCRASHAACWLRCVALQENLLIFEDDVMCDTDIDWASLSEKADAIPENSVAFFEGRGNTHAYVVTPNSAAELLERHLEIVNPVNMVQMSVDHRIQYSAHQGWVDLEIIEGTHFWQHGDRERSDNEWGNPIALGVDITYPD